MDMNRRESIGRRRESGGEGDGCDPRVIELRALLDGLDLGRDRDVEIRRIVEAELFAAAGVGPVSIADSVPAGGGDGRA